MSASPFKKVELEVTELVTLLHYLKYYSIKAKRTKKTVLCMKNQYSVCILKAIKAQLIN